MQPTMKSHGERLTVLLPEELLHLETTILSALAALSLRFGLGFGPVQETCNPPSERREWGEIGYDGNGEVGKRRPRRIPLKTHTKTQLASLPIAGYRPSQVWPSSKNMTASHEKKRRTEVQTACENMPRKQVNTGCVKKKNRPALRF